MKIVFMGTPDFAAIILKGLYDAGHEIIAAVSQPDRPRGRRQSEPKPTEVKAMAHSLSIPVLQPESPNTPEFIDTLRELGPDVIVVAAYGRILKPEVLSVPPFGAINVHASLLPRWRGAAPIQWAIIAGDRETGVTTMQMDEGLDTGDILLSESTPIGNGEDAPALYARLAAMGAKLIVRTLDLLPDGEIIPRPQPDSGASYAPMLKKEMGLIDWSADADGIAHRVLGLSPWPGAYSYAGDRMIKILNAAAADDPLTGEPGTAAVTGGRLLVCTGRGVLEIFSLQPEGKKAMKAGDFLRGHTIDKFMSQRRI